MTNDLLGTPRINTDANGNVIARHDYLPFGEEVFTPQRTQGLGYTADNVRQKFTAYERDNESDLDYAQARYYNPKHGRFTSVDPLMASARKANPQTFNRYSYVLNNPYSFTDPSGMKPCPEGQTCYIDEDGTEHTDDEPIRVENAKESLPGCGLVACSSAYDPISAEFSNPPGSPITLPNPQAQPSTSTGNKFASNAVRSLRSAGPAFGASLVLNELAFPSQSVGAPTCDAIPDGCTKPEDVPDNSTIVKGGTAPEPSPGLQFSGAFGDSLYTAGQGVPHNQLIFTTAEIIRRSGGTVVYAPEEAYPGGPINYRHVNIILGPAGGAFIGPILNPAPKELRIPGRPK